MSSIFPNTPEQLARANEQVERERKIEDAKASGLVPLIEPGDVTDAAEANRYWSHMFYMAMKRVVDDNGKNIFWGPTAKEEAGAFKAGLEHMRDVVLRLGAMYGNRKRDAEIQRLRAELKSRDLIREKLEANEPPTNVEAK